jgi:hypothetical protein
VARGGADFVAVVAAPGARVDAPDPVAVAADLLRGAEELVPPAEPAVVPPPVAVARGVVLRGVLDVLDDGLGVELGLGVAVGVAVAAGGALLGAPPEPNANPITEPDGGSYSATPLLL